MALSDAARRYIKKQAKLIFESVEEGLVDTVEDMLDSTYVHIETEEDVYEVYQLLYTQLGELFTEFKFPRSDELFK